MKRTAREPRASLPTEASEMTWPHGSSIGGLSGVLTSLETGQAKWEWCAGGSPATAGSSTGSWRHERKCLGRVSEGSGLDGKLAAR